jgi:Zn ribbon nucleic-acid-binding protein
MTSNRSCPICNKCLADRLEVYSPAEWDLVTCIECGFVYLLNPPDYEDLEEKFAWETTYIKKKVKGWFHTIVYHKSSFTHACKESRP